MAEHETIADIRKDAEAKFHELVEAYMQRRAAFQTTVGAMQAFNTVFDRLEAAHKRERGDCAKLRKALVRVLDWLKRMNAQPLNTLAVSELTPSYAVNRTAKSIIEDNDYHISQLTAALAAPPRNCDRFATIDEARKAHEEYRGDYIMRASNIFDFPMKFEAWLFAPATEKEGGVNG